MWRAVELPSKLQFGCGLSPLSEPIPGQAGQLVGISHVGHVAQHWLNHSPGIVEPAALECLRGGSKPLLVAIRTPGLGGAIDIRGNVLGQHRLRIDTPTREWAVNERATRCTLGDVAYCTLVDPLLSLPCGSRGRARITGRPLTATSVDLGCTQLGGRLRPLHAPGRNATIPRRAAALGASSTVASEATTSRTITKPTTITTRPTTTSRTITKPTTITTRPTTTSRPITKPTTITTRPTTTSRTITKPTTDSPSSALPSGATLWAVLATGVLEGTLCSAAHATARAAIAFGPCTPPTASVILCVEPASSSW